MGLNAEGLWGLSQKPRNSMSGLVTLFCFTIMKPFSKARLR